MSSPSFAFRKIVKTCADCGKKYRQIARPGGIVKKSDPKPHVCRGKKSAKRSQSKKSTKRSRSKKSTKRSRSKKSTKRSRSKKSTKRSRSVKK